MDFHQPATVIAIKYENVTKVFDEIKLEEKHTVCNVLFRVDI